ncbi:MAG: hypothetical protein Q4B32_10670 [Clostridia bacterium]|nr:hypothetical protein [Clostridia bacterium]
MNQDMDSSFLEEFDHEAQHIEYEQALQKIKELEAYVDALAKHSLSLEKKLLVAEENDEVSAPIACPMCIALFYENGYGLSEEQVVKETVTPKGDLFTAVLKLPEDAAYLRLDPGDDPCVIRNLIIDPPLEMSAENGIALDSGIMVFDVSDPNIGLKREGGFHAGEKITLSFEYERLFQDQQNSLIGMLATDCQAESRELHALQQELGAICTSKSWKITHPIRTLKRLLQHRA